MCRAGVEVKVILQRVRRLEKVETIGKVKRRRECALFFLPTTGCIRDGRIKGSSVSYFC